MQGESFCDFLFDDFISFVQKKKENARSELGLFSVFSYKRLPTHAIDLQITMIRLASSDDEVVVDPNRP
jgi:hypothetical protein